MGTVLALCNPNELVGASICGSYFLIPVEYSPTPKNGRMAHTWIGDSERRIYVYSDWYFFLSISRLSESYSVGEKLDENCLVSREF
jgi:hypothetical protein